MKRVASVISEAQVNSGSLAVFFLGQAGFAFKSSSGTIIYLDAYLSNYNEENSGEMWQRRFASPVAPEEAQADLWLSTHNHEDHLDPESVPVVCEKTKARFVGPTSVVRRCLTLGVPVERTVTLNVGEEAVADDVRLWGIWASHMVPGFEQPDATGILFEVDGIRVYHTGDTILDLKAMSKALELHPDILLVPVNGLNVSMRAHEAAQLAQAMGPEVVVPMHTGLFFPHVGDELDDYVREHNFLRVDATVVLPKLGGCFIYTPCGA